MPDDFPSPLPTGPLWRLWLAGPQVVGDVILVMDVSSVIRWLLDWCEAERRLDELVAVWRIEAAGGIP